MQYASFRKRLFATLIDMIVINVGVMIAGELFLDTAILQEIVAQAETGILQVEQVQALIHAVLVLGAVSLLLVTFIDAILPATAMMGTPGKNIVGIVITDTQGKRLSYAKAIGRHTAKFISATILFGFLMPLWSDKKQALHDKMCGTVVVRKKGTAGL